ncbi:PAN2-PAN3 deadenylation complex subunit pan3-like [Tubulanus polymorphus]|uniref:PAN2-PAN3 deadenylation complex subunit pan3-like n=1 Tax=Tubulanus polymorphus TaxID=672921 RepID=UPI003DA21F42
MSNPVPAAATSGTALKKQATASSVPCKYYLNTGSCFYRDDCQYLHHDLPPNSVGLRVAQQQMKSRPPFDRSTPPFDLIVGDSNLTIPQQPSNPEANNGDEFFNATFSASTGLPDFNSILRMKNTTQRSSPLRSVSDNQGKYLVAPQNAAMMEANVVDSLENGLNGLDINNKHHGLHAPTSVEFSAAKSSVAGTLSHSASTPSFGSTYGHMLTGATTTANHISQHTTAGIMPMSAGTSPVASPGLSPTQSPLAQRRNKSPQPLKKPEMVNNNGNNPAATFHENVGGTTYFFTPDALAQQVQGVMLPSLSMYPGVPPHIAHMKPRPTLASFACSEEIKMEMLNRSAVTMLQIDPDSVPDIPVRVDNYESLYPLEPPPSNSLHKSSTFGYPTTCYKAHNTKDGLIYCLRRIHGYRLTNTKCMSLIDMWKKLQHTNIVQLREVFTTKSFGDHSIVFVYDFHAGSETLMHRHFMQGRLNGFNNPFSNVGATNASSGRHFGKGAAAGGVRQTTLLPESLIWNYIVQLTSALRTIHAAGLACRVMDPTKILLQGKSRLWLNCVGIFDVLGFDATQSNPMGLMPHYQQEDMVSLGKVVLALACNSVMGIQREHLQASVDLVARNYSADLKNLILYLLSNHNRIRSVNDIMPMIGARFYTQLEAAQIRNDLLENELAKEIENSRLCRLITKLGIINERQEFNMDPSWSETGDRYMLKLFRDYVFHQVDENGAPWIDMAHIVQSLNKLDAGTHEKICLMSRDAQTVLLVSYAELKQCFDSAFNEVLHASHMSELASSST